MSETNTADARNIVETATNHDPNNPFDNQLKNIGGGRESYEVNPHYHSILVSQAAKKVFDEIERKESRKWNVFLASSSILVGLLVAIGGFLGNILINSTVENKLKDEFTRKEFAQFEFRIKSAELSRDAEQFVDQDGIGIDSAKSVINDVKNLYTLHINNPAISIEQQLQNLEILEGPTRSVAKSFAQTNRPDLILDLQKVAPRVFEGDFGTIEIASVFSLHLIGAPNGRGDWENSQAELYDLYKLYETTIQNVRVGGYPEIYIASQLVIRNMEGADPKELSNLADRYASLSSVDKDSFKQFWRVLLSGSIFEGREDTPEASRVTARTIAVAEKICPLPAFRDVCDLTQRPEN